MQRIVTRFWQDRAMRRIGLLLVFACGGGGSGGGDVWSVRVTQFASAACETTCIPEQAKASCFTNVVSNLDNARFGITDEGFCINCLRAKTTLVAQVVANNCMVNGELEEQLAVDCDSSPIDDFDFDGDPANDTEEACLGAGRYPFDQGDPNPMPL